MRYLDFKNKEINQTYIRSVMIQFSSLILPYLHKTFFVLKATFTTKKGLFILPTLAISLPVLSTKQHIGLMLTALMIGDFITGLAVSNLEKKKLEKTDPDLKNNNLFSSDKFKTKTGVKLVLYMSTTFIAYWGEHVLKINTFNIPISSLDFTITIAVMCVWMGVEIHSIVFENIKKLGFDVLAIFGKMKKVWTELKKTSE